MKERAKRVLTYYVKKAWEAAGLKWTGDNDAEIGDIVEDIINELRP